MELGGQSFHDLEELMEQKVKMPEESMGVVENKFQERLEYLQNDIVRKQRKRF